VVNAITRKPRTMNAKTGRRARPPANGSALRLAADRRLLVVEPDPACGRTLAALFRRAGHEVRLVRTRAAALRAARESRYDLAVVDLFVAGGGVELARELARRVRRILLSVGPILAREEMREWAVGFPIRRKADLAGLLRPVRYGAAAR
jgi:CheY-like chemotaxis protein